VNDLRNFYKGKKVFITGHTGFKGAWLSMFLIELGAEVIGYSLDPKTENDLFVKARIDELVTDIRGDVRNKNYLESKLIEHQPEIVFHLAAQPLVIESYINPFETWEINVMGSINLLEALKKLDSVKSVVVVTTDKVYKNMENELGYSEDDPLGGHDPYSSSKAAVELAVDSWRNSFFFESNEKPLGIATARAGNVIGGGDWAENRLIPDFFKAYLTENFFELRNPNSIRPWQHVLDVIYGYVLLAEKLYLNPVKFSTSFNFSSDDNNGFTTEFIIDYLSKKLSVNLQKKYHSNKTFKETTTLRLINKKAAMILEWKTRLSLEQSLDYTVDYFIKTLSKSSREVVCCQIKEFLLKKSVSD
jgi:CDP-glucose 4,6-dehydratase